MNGSNQPEPPIREFRNRWPFYSENGLKWLLSGEEMESQDVEENLRSSFAFKNDKQVEEGYTLGQPRSLVFQESDVNGQVDALPVESRHSDEEAPIVFDVNESAVEADCSSDDQNTAEYFTPSKPTLDHSGVGVSEEEDESDEEEVMNSAVKRMSFALEDGKTLPKFSPDDVILAINCGGSMIENESHGISFKRDEYFTGGDVLRTDEEVTGVHDASLYQTSRYGDVSYVFKDLPLGNLVVDLHFAEIIFTNGPPGMRVFDVTVQEEKVITELDVYEEVGSNNALILSVSTSTSDGSLTVAFEGVIGSPSISAICIRSAPMTSCPRGSRKAGSAKRKIEGTPDAEPLAYEQELLKKDNELRQITEHKARRQQAKKKLSKSEYEARLEELKNECHEAWISLQDSNRMNEMLQNDLCAKSLTVESLATAVENQLSEMNGIKERSRAEKQRWISTMSAAYKELTILKEEQQLLSSRTKEWVSTFPDPTVMTRSVRTLLNEHQDLRRKYADECFERKLLYNKVLELKGNIRVFCRCRPLSQTEVAANAVSVAEFEAAGNGDIVVRNGTAGKKLFKFDRVFSPQDDQTDVFADTAPVVVSVLDGFNVCIFAYGQTGTGKTFTMEGTVANRGVNYRTLEELFNVAAQRKGEVNYDVSVSVMEIYNEQIRDLLATPAAQDQATKKLEIKQAAEGGHHVPGLVEAQVSSMEEVWDVLQAGSSSRTVGSTRANDLSSRSHCMLCVMVRGENIITGEITKSKLWLVDLAGSERVAKSDAQGDRLKEAQNINKSLSALGDVIQALTMKSSHIPFRNSKLTHLLQDSLGGDSKTLMFVQISPNEADVSETLCSLNFASRVRGVELGPARKQLDSGELFKYKQLAEKTKQEVRTKDESVRKLEEKLQAAEAKLKAKEQTCQALSEKVKEAGEVDVQLLNERRARQAAEAMYREQKANMEKMAAESKLSLERLAEKSAAELRQAKEALAAELRQAKEVETKQAKEAVELQHAKEALAAELKQVKDALQSASAAHTKEVSRLLQQLQQANELRKAPVTHEPMTTPFQQLQQANELRKAPVHEPMTTPFQQLQQANELRKAPVHEPMTAPFQQLQQANELRKAPVHESMTTPLPSIPPKFETVLRRPALVEAGSTPVAVDRTPTVEYVVKPPDSSEVMRNSCTGEVFGNENAAPPSEGVAEAQTKAKGILKQSSATKYVSPSSNGAVRIPGRPRKTGFTVKPAVQVNSLVRRSQESGVSSCNSQRTSLTEEEIQRLCGGLDMIAASNTSTFDSSLQTLAQVLDSNPLPKSAIRAPASVPKSVHFRNPLLLPPREQNVDSSSSSFSPAENVHTAVRPAVKAARRTAVVSSRPQQLGRSPVTGAHRVVAPVKLQAVSALREKRWN